MSGRVDVDALAQPVQECLDLGLQSWRTTRVAPKFLTACDNLEALVARVRDLESAAKVCPTCGHEWRSHDPEDGECDAHSEEPGIFGPCRCGRDVGFTAKRNAEFSRAALGGDA